MYAAVALITLLMGVPAAVVYALNGAGAAAGARLVLALCFVPALPFPLSFWPGPGPYCS